MMYLWKRQIIPALKHFRALGLFMSATICVDILQFSFTSICRYYSSLKQHIYLFIRYLETVKPLYGFLFSPDSHPFLFSFCFYPLFLHVIFHTVGRSRLCAQGPCLSQAQGSPGRRERNPREESPPPTFTTGSPEVLMASLHAAPQCTVGDDLQKRNQKENIDCESIKPCIL